jgi:predicted RNase H-like HicB family nuclease
MVWKDACIFELKRPKALTPFLKRGFIPKVVSILSWIIVGFEVEENMSLTGVIKKSGNCYVALCLELNVSSEGESIDEARRMLQEACKEYLAYMKDEGLEDGIQPVPLDVLREFLIDDVEFVRPSPDWAYSESITFEVCASV